MKKGWPVFGEELVTRTRFIAPVPKRSHLERPRLHRRLEALRDVPLALVIAGTGYGKSSLLAGYFQATQAPLLWYELSERDADPQLFALHLAHLCHRSFPGAADRALDRLALPGGATRHGPMAIEALADALLDRLTEDTFLVLDDFHWLQGAEATIALVNHLVAVRPPKLHVVLASRHKPELPDLARWKLQGELVTLDQAALAFTAEEVEGLLERAYGLALPAETVSALLAETEGWPIALQLLAQRLHEDPAGALAPHAGSLRDLFDYLAREVLEKLSDDERSFLLATAPLERLAPAVCAALGGREDAAELLRALNERGLFLIPIGAGQFRHHHLFREFLLERLAESGQLREAHLAAAKALGVLSESEEAIEHLLAADELGTAAGLMARVAPQLVNQGRYARLATWLSRLPEALLDRAPALAICQGDACRLGGRFEEALAWYARAERGYAESPDGRSRALAGQALVYLDTVRPAQANDLLEKAVASAEDPQRRAELLVLLAENKLNQGDTAGAARLFGEARAVLPEIAENEARVCLRTGRLEEARAILKAAIAQTPEDAATKAHREPSLVLALVEAMTGEPEAARALAAAGLARARRQQATHTEAVALIRAAHAALVAGDRTEAEADYRQAVALSRAVGVPRLKAEPLMGLALLAGRAGDLAAAEAFVKEGLEVTQETGDAWVSALLGLSLGACYAAHGDPKAERWLSQAQHAYERCGDTFGQAVVALWAARLALALGEAKALMTRVRALADLARRHGYGFLLTRPTLLGFADAASARAFALAALDKGVPRAMLMPWLTELGLAEEELELPNDALRVRVLGRFRVWRGQEELPERAFSREKARALFHLLVAERERLLPKGQIIDTLWPDLDAGSADGTFRVALNALNKALEPDRSSGAPSRFVVRQGANYGLSEELDLWLDVREFERLLDAAAALEGAGEDATELYRQALSLYEGDFLGEFTHYEAWAERERERLSDRFKAGCLRLARLLAARGDFAGAAHFAQRLIDKEPCAEEAYRLLMIAQYKAGDRPMAIRTYDRCVVALSDELDVDPMPETQALYDRIANLQPVELDMLAPR